HYWKSKWYVLHFQNNGCISYSKIFFGLVVQSFVAVSYPTYPSSSSSSYHQVPLPAGVVGPESFDFDCRGEGPYTSVSDGRILKWLGARHGWSEFAFTAPDGRRELCDGSSDPELEPTCGRPLGLRFHTITCELYIADAYFGLVRVGRGGGAATQLAITAEGGTFKFTNNLDIDPENDIVYFTDSSTKYTRREHWRVALTGDSTARFMKYDPQSREVSVLLRGLKFANGVALSKENNFVLIAETSASRVLRYWLKVPRANSTEVFSQVPGAPDNVKRNARGEFWVALNNGRTSPSYRDEILGVRIDGEGRLLEALHGDGEMESVSEVAEYNGNFLLGSVVTPFVSIFTKSTMNNLLIGSY
ncbi:hypothetical protein IFM89_013867, partial [Coptis chinensis]